MKLPAAEWPCGVTERCYITAVQWLRIGVVLCLVAGEAVAQPRPATRPDEFFVHPEALCKALEELGIHTGPWAPMGKGPHYDKVPFECDNVTAPDSDKNVPFYKGGNTIFRVSGDWPSRADIISVAAPVANPADWQAAQAEFQGLVAAIFRFIGKPEPAGLVRAIQRRQHYQVRRTYGIIWFNFVAPMDPSPRRTFWFRLSQGSVPANR